MRSRLLPRLALLFVGALCALPLRAQVRQTNPFTDSLTFTPPNSGYASTITSALRLGDHLLLNGPFTASRLVPQNLNTTGIWFIDVRTGEALSGTPFHAVVGPDSAGKTASVPTPGDGLIAYRRGELVRLSSDASVQDRWALSANGDVSGMRLHGDTLFLFGGFTRIAGQERRGVAAVKMASREVLAFTPPQFFGAFQAPYTITDLRVIGGRVYVQGTYEVVDGAARSGPVALERQTGALLPWQPATSAKLTTTLFHDQGLLGCFVTASTRTWTCERYSYTDGSVNLSRIYDNDESFSIEGVHGSGWVVHRRKFVGFRYSYYLDFYDSTGSSYNNYETNGESIVRFLYRNNSRYNMQWIFDYHYGSSFSGTSRHKLYTMRPSDRDTMTARTFAHFGGYPQQLSFLGHQVYASTDPAYALPLPGPEPPSWPAQLPLDLARQRVDTSFARSVCGEVRASALSGTSVYYGGYFQKGGAGRCSGPFYQIVRLTAAGEIDPTFTPPNLWGTGNRGEVLQLQPMSRGLLVGTFSALYQPDITQRAAGALGLFNAAGQLIPPFFGVTSGSSNLQVRRTVVLGDSVVVATGRFTMAGGAPRNGFAVLRLSDGTATSAQLPAGVSFEKTGLEVVGNTAFVSGVVGSTNQPIARVPLDGSPSSTLCADVSAGQLLAQTGGRLLVATPDRLFVLDPATCQRTYFVYSDNSFFNLPVTGALVDGATIWAFGSRRLYALSNPFPVANDQGERPLGDATPGVRVWPNPARTSSVQVAGGAATMEREARAFDVLGREVWRAPLAVGEASVTWSVESLSSGVYVVRVVEASSGRVVGSARLVRAR